MTKSNILNLTRRRKAARAQKEEPKKKLFGCQTHELTGSITGLRQEMDLARLDYKVAVEVATGGGNLALIRLPANNTKLTLGARVKIVVIVQ